MTGALDVRAVPRRSALGASDTGPLWIDTADCAPEAMRRFRVFNPFHVWDERWLPVPGSSQRSRSVEAVWQGSKLVGGATDESLFGAGAVTKRPPEDERGAGWTYAAQRFRFGGESVGLIDARYLLYVPAYLRAIERALGSAVDDEIRAAALSGRAVRFYDWDDNFEIEDERSAFSHSALLAAWYGATFEARYRPGLAARADRFGAPAVLRTFDEIVGTLTRP